MLERYKQLFSELKLLEHQLRQKCYKLHGKEIAFRMLHNSKEFIDPDELNKILGGKNGKK